MTGDNARHPLFFALPCQRRSFDPSPGYFGADLRPRSCFAAQVTWGGLLVLPLACPGGSHSTSVSDETPVRLDRASWRAATLRPGDTAESNTTSVGRGGCTGSLERTFGNRPTNWSPRPHCDVPIGKSTTSTTTGCGSRALTYDRCRKSLIPSPISAWRRLRQADSRIRTDVLLLL